MAKSDSGGDNTMDTGKDDKSGEQEWQWCLVGNIVREHEYGENHEIRYGNKQFYPNTKVFVNLVYGGMGYEYIHVIGTPRHSCKYIEVVIPKRHVENFRLQKVFKPAVLKRMNQSKERWWGNTDSARDAIIGVLGWLNPVEAEKARNKYMENTNI